MSFQTTKLRFIVEQSLDDQLLEHSELYWPKAYAALGLDDYPIYDEETRKVTTGDCLSRVRLNDKIIRRFYMNEIGQETIGLFRWYMRSTMHEIMGEYNPLYESLTYLTDPLREYEESITDSEGTTGNENREHSSKRDGGRDLNSKRDMSGSRDSESVFSNTPENMLATGDVANKRYATTLNYDSSTDSENETKVDAETHTDNETGDESSTRSEERDYTRERHGHTQSQMKLIKEYQELLWNIDMQVLEDKRLNDCFMLVWE